MINCRRQQTQITPPNESHPDSIILDCHVQIAARDTEVDMPGGIADLRQRAAAGQRIADEGVGAVAVSDHPPPASTHSSLIVTKSMPRLS
jgi:hypothetical protein